MKVLIFDIWADYAHFKKYYTTTSPLTFSLPPKTVIYGILGAILGLDKSEYLHYFQQKQCKIGIQVLKPIAKVRMGLNLIDTKSAKVGWSRFVNHTQIRTEYLKDVAYRLYVYHEDQELYNRLKYALQNHLSFYTVSLGLSENLANFAFVGEEEVTEKQADGLKIEISTALRIDDGNVAKGDVDFNQTGREYFADKFAIEMKPDREVVDYGQVLFERKGQPILLSPKFYYQLTSGVNILFI